VETGDSAAIFERPQHPYTRALMAAAFEIKAEETGAVRT
jgi:microcin C transport system ATP-binding protein